MSELYTVKLFSNYYSCITPLYKKNYIVYEK